MARVNTKFEEDERKESPLLEHLRMCKKAGMDYWDLDSILDGEPKQRSCVVPFSTEAELDEFIEIFEGARAKHQIRKMLSRYAQQDDPDLEMARNLVYRGYKLDVPRTVHALRDTTSIELFGLYLQMTDIEAIAEGDRDFLWLCRTWNRPTEKLKFIFEKILNPHEKGPFSMYPIYYACQIKKPLEILKWFAEKGVSFTTRDNPNETLLHAMGSRKCDDSVKFIISKGVDVNAVGYRGYTPLHLACADKNRRVIRCLLDHGANPHKADLYGKFPADCLPMELLRVLFFRGCALRIPYHLHDDDNEELHEIFDGHSRMMNRIIQKAGLPADMAGAIAAFL